MIVIPPGSIVRTSIARSIDQLANTIQEHGKQGATVAVFPHAGQEYTVVGWRAPAEPKLEPKA